MHSRPSDSRSTRARLSVESLEDRLAPATFTVVNTNDSGLGSLRQAIVRANATPGSDTINFNISGSGVQTIFLTSALPAVTDTLAIAGNTQPGVTTSPLVELSGFLAGSGANGLSLNAAGSVVRGLVISGFAANGIAIRADNCIVQRCYVGTDATGTTSLGNFGNGVLIAAGAAGNGSAGFAWRERAFRKRSGRGENRRGGCDWQPVLGNIIGLRVDGLLAWPTAWACGGEWSRAT